MLVKCRHVVTMHMYLEKFREEIRGEERIILWAEDLRQIPLNDMCKNRLGHLYTPHL